MTEQELTPVEYEMMALLMLEGCASDEFNTEPQECSEHHFCSLLLTALPNLNIHECWVTGRLN